MTIAIRKFKEEDISYKVKWINDERNNKYLHYDLPLREDKTLQWFKSLEGKKDRMDYIITYEGKPAGLIGLLNIDFKKMDAEYYISLGTEEFKGKGIASIATDLLIKKSYEEFDLNKIYLFTEVDNIQAQKLFERNGFNKEKLIKKDLFYNGRYIDRYFYTLDVEKYIHRVGGLNNGSR